MTLITNIQHFLEDNKDVPDLPFEARELLSYLSSIIEAATMAYDKPLTLTDIKCRGVLSGNPCCGEIAVWVYADDNEIGWECVECDADGVISHWEGSRWDKRSYTRH